ncbi:MAG: thymidylate synthase [Candidatus Sumerlaeia bacterium]|nr:thymidylate synthase [Candidatus Sumerlaeia bacterium]
MTNEPLNPPERRSVIDIRARNLPEAWERSVVACWQDGDAFRTEYDKPGDPPSRDAVMRIVVEQPMSEPRIHRAIPCGLADLEIYRQEVLFGVHDNWICPQEGRWEYTYHERLFAYRVPGVGTFDQIEKVVEKLAEAPHTRRAQAVTWQVWQDIGISDPACLQRLWFRVFDNRQLDMHASMRSNDAFKAAFMNMYAFTDLQRWVAERLSERMGREIAVGRYIHEADSYHIYGSYFGEFERFLKLIASKSFEERTLSSADVKDMLDDGRIILFNGTQSDIPLPEEHLRRLWDEIPESRRGELDPKQTARIQRLTG